MRLRAHFPVMCYGWYKALPCARPKDWTNHARAATPEPMPYRPSLCCQKTHKQFAVERLQHLCAVTFAQALIAVKQALA